MPFQPKAPDDKRGILIPVKVSKNDLEAVGGRSEMSKILRDARDKAVKRKPKK